MCLFFYFFPAIFILCGLYILLEQPARKLLRPKPYRPNNKHYLTILR